MGDNTKIEWTDATINPIRARRKDNEKIGWHCVKISPECQHCYAESTNKRNMPACGTGLPYTVASTDLVEMLFDYGVMNQMLRWKRPRKVFPCSMTDLFGEFVPDQCIRLVFAYFALAKEHTFQVLTKRSKRACELISGLSAFDWRLAIPETCMEVDMYKGEIYVNDQKRGWPLSNVWIGATTGNQEQADNRIPWLLRTPAAKRFISYEPALGPLRLWKLTSLDYHENTIGYETYPLAGMQAIPDSDWEHPKLDWVIAGGESGRSARPAHPQWFRDVRDQCVEAGVPFFFKQLLENRKKIAKEHWPVDLQVQEFPV